MYKRQTELWAGNVVPDQRPTRVGITTPPVGSGSELRILKSRQRVKIHVKRNGNRVSGSVRPGGIRIDCSDDCNRYVCLQERCGKQRKGGDGGFHSRLIICRLDAAELVNFNSVDQSDSGRVTIPKGVFYVWRNFYTFIRV